MLLSYTIVDFYLFNNGAVDMQMYALLTRTQCKVSNTQVTVKACGPLVGLASAPRVFTKIMKPVLAHLGQQGISPFYYIDDSLIEAETFDTCKAYAHFLVELFPSLGFTINKEKSMLIPSRRISYLGHIIDSTRFKVYLPDEIN